MTLTKNDLTETIRNHFDLPKKKLAALVYSTCPEQLSPLPTFSGRPRLESMEGTEP